MNHPHVLEPALVRAYLDRLGLDSEPPSIEALSRLHRAHAERVPYETLWIQLSEPWSIDPVAAAHRIATRRRGGYCFHLNGAFAALLGTLGYDVALHAGTVYGPAGPQEAYMGGHAVITVRGLPDPRSPQGAWYVDVGLGDGPYEPVPLVPGAVTQGPFTYELAATPGGVGDWQWTQRPASVFHGMTWRAEAVTMDRYLQSHTRLSSSPESPFVRVLCVQRRHAGGTDSLRARTYRRAGDHIETTILHHRNQLSDLLTDTFGFGRDAFSPTQLDALWAHAVRSHDEWLAQQAGEDSRPAEGQPATGNGG